MIVDAIKKMDKSLKAQFDEEQGKKPLTKWDQVAYTIEYIKWLESAVLRWQKEAQFWHDQYQELAPF